MKCRYCAKEISDQATFCWYCGRELVTRPERPAEVRSHKNSGLIFLIIIGGFITLILLMTLLR